MKISIIIPVFNEAALLPQTLRSIEKLEDKNIEVIVVDGGSHDETQAVALRHGHKWVFSSTGRGPQMNKGAVLAKGGILLFLHGDSQIEAGGLDAIRESCRNEKVVGGGFRLGIDSKRRGLRFISSLANLRTRFTHIPYGDQGIFVRKKVFDQLGGFRNFPILEDLDFCRRLKKEGKIALLHEKVWTSPRRWEKEGIMKVTLRNQILLFLYFAGVSPMRLVRWYQNIR